MDKAIHFIQNISKYWVFWNLDVKRRIQRLVFPGGFYIDPVNRQYLTDKVNSLFHFKVELTRVSRGGIKSSKMKTVKYPDTNFSGREIVQDLVKVIVT